MDEQIEMHTEDRAIMPSLQQSLQIIKGLDIGQALETISDLHSLPLLTLLEFAPHLELLIVNELAGRNLGPAVARAIVRAINSSNRQSTRDTLKQFLLNMALTHADNAVLKECLLKVFGEPLDVAQAAEWHDERSLVASYKAEILIHDREPVPHIDKKRRITSTAFVNIGTIDIIPQQSNQQTALPFFVETPTMFRNLQSFALGLLSPHSSLLLSSKDNVPCGKSLLINYVAALLSVDPITIHLDSTIDAKSLLGAYVCGATPGEFTWCPGPLVQAASQGRWLVIENIDLAPPELLSALGPVLEKGVISIPSRGETIVSSPGFRLIATVATSTQTLQDLLNGLFHHVLVECPTEEEQQDIINRLHPSMTPLLPHALGMLRALSKVRGIGRVFGLRDLLKWSRRMIGYTQDNPLLANAEDLSAVPLRVREAAFIEAADCFCSLLPPKSSNYDGIMSLLADSWCVPAEAVEHYVHLSKPDTQTIGRAHLMGDAGVQVDQSTFAATGHAMRNMERIAVATVHNEPVLLVGETGTGKTTLVQKIAQHAGKKLVALNLSQQTDSSDLLGGFKPIDASESVLPLLDTFNTLVFTTWSKGNNDAFLERVTKLARKKKWIHLLKVFRTTTDKAIQGKNRQRWLEFGSRLALAEQSVAAAEGGLAFSFVEGALVKALHKGWWLLLDEINLAPPEALERIAGLLEDSQCSLTVMERGDARPVARHADFRLFAAMNPATDAGKRDLPTPFRNRFTEFWIAEPTQRDDLAAIVASYLSRVAAGAPVHGVVEFYLGAKSEGDATLQDSAGHKPAYNLRTLCRSLEYTSMATPVYGLQRALYDGLSMSFVTQLEAESATIIEGLMQDTLFGNSDIKRLLKTHPGSPGPNYILFDQYWVEKGPEPEMKDVDPFVETPTVTQHLRNLARAVLLRRYPILLQGPTSSGKTSLVAHLAHSTGHKFVRINNHEQTDLQEYLGSYVSDAQGRLIFREGLLVQAVRSGHWIVLDELNLAPTEVLEALNRLLDDNRELYVPELQETIQPHPHFMLFATQNPPGIYAGRKTLSRALRSRFLELHVDDIPDNELSTILERRCAIAPSYAAKLVLTMRELQRYRAASNVFAGRHGFITPRDLFRWANRGAVGYQQLAEDGYALLGERLRTVEERELVRITLANTLGVRVDIESTYLEGLKPLNGSDSFNRTNSILKGIVWTPSMRRMYHLLHRCLEFSEPALLVGETGTGKTTVCQIAADVRGQELRIINCNQHTEVSDFLGGFRPNRSRDSAIVELRNAIAALNSLKICAEVQLGATSHEALQSLSISVSNISDLRAQEIVAAIKRSIGLIRAPFEWCDGPLVLAMKNGDMILIDELNLADDAVLERLNSVLEPGRTLTLAEKAGAVAEVIKAHPSFRIVATMNPGGDFGKKELSPALTNRFTCVWVPSLTSEQEVRAIIESCFDSENLRALIVPRMVGFWRFFKENALNLARQAFSIRDLLAWAQFITLTAHSIGVLASYVHGAHLTLLDGVGLGVGLSVETAEAVRSICLQFLAAQLPDTERDMVFKASGSICNELLESGMQDKWGIAPFFIERDTARVVSGEQFNFQAPTTLRNSLKVLRALQLRKPVLLEGSPGVGKTSLVSALARTVGQELVRINLSEQTDMMDLLGADLPVDGGAAGEFAWSDGPLLHAIKSGAWVLLDELNLANQTVLEGLNSVLDHRAEVFIPELGATFQCPLKFRVFAAQNPLQEGGGRRGLPKSFLNRFIRVHVDLLQTEDLRCVMTGLHPHLASVQERMVTTVQRLHQEANISRLFGNMGGPWEFNLRDLLRWCELINKAAASVELLDWEGLAVHYIPILFLQRLRTSGDRSHALSILQQVWGANRFETSPRIPALRVDATSISIGNCTLGRRAHGSWKSTSQEDLLLLKSQMTQLECLAECVRMQWMCLVTGPSGTGKTALVRTLAQLCQRELLELSLNSGTDTSDLLGGFEQVDCARKVEDLGNQIEGLLNTLSVSLLQGHQLKVVGRLWSAWYKAEKELTLMLHVLTAMNQFIVDNNKEFGHLKGQVDSALMEADRVRTFVERAGDSLAGKFEWVDGMLTRAIQHGHWVLLDNANLCNPTVLDRLNPLLEPHGTLFLNECGIGADGPRMLKPHPEFRLFLTLDPRHGEVSRAMRNRGIEVFLLHHERNKKMAEESESVVGLEGIPGQMVPAAMSATHHLIVDQLVAEHRRAPCLRELRRWASMTIALVQRGWSMTVALGTAFDHTYVRPERLEDSKQLAVAAYAACCLPLLGQGNVSEEVTLFRPAIWPVSLTVADFSKEFLASEVQRDGDVILYHICHLAYLSRGSYLMPSDSGIASSMLLLQDRWPQSGVAGAEYNGILQVLASQHAAAIYAEHGRYDSPARVDWLLGLQPRLMPSLENAPLALEAFRLVEKLVCSILMAHPHQQRDRVVPPSAVITACMVDLRPQHDTLLQWSYKMHQEECQSAPLHPCVEWLWPLFDALSKAEVCITPEAVASLQEWRWALLLVTHLHPIQSSPSHLPLHFELLVFTWAGLKKVIRKVLEAAGGDWREGGLLRQAAAQMDASLGLSEGPPPEPLLWKYGGRPFLPNSLELSQGQGAVLRLCQTATYVGARGFEVGHRGYLAVLESVGVCLGSYLCDTPMQDDVDMEKQHVEKETVAQCVMASISSDAHLRRSLAEGTCLYASALALNKGKVQGLPDLLCSEVSATAAAVIEEAVKALQPADVAMMMSDQDASSKEDRKQLLPMSQLALVDNDDAAGTLPKDLMLFPSCRGYQLLLLGLQGLSGSKALLETLCNHVLGLLMMPLNGICSLQASEFRDAFHLCLSSNGRSTVEASAYLQLQWLAESPNEENEWQNRLAQSSAHQAWYSWLHSQLDNVSDCASIIKTHLSGRAYQRWKLFDGPMRAHTSCMSGLAVILSSGHQARIADRSAKLLQLKLASRQLREPRRAESRAHMEWKGCITVLAVTLQAHVSSVPEGQERNDFSAGLDWLCRHRIRSSERSPVADDSFLCDMKKTITVCSHSVFKEMLGAVLLPCMQELLLKSEEAVGGSADGLAIRGRAWALLGLARLHLTVPPAETDPAAKFELYGQHLLQSVHMWLEPELATRRQFHSLPGGPDESARIQELEEEVARRIQKAEELRTKATPRPSPPAYFAVRDDICRYVSGFAGVDRVTAMIRSISDEVHSTEEVMSWQENTAAWVERLEDTYLEYRDIIRPVQMAAHELRFGLSLLVGSGLLRKDERAVSLLPTLSHLLSYPHSFMAPAPALMGKSLQRTVSILVSESMRADSLLMATDEAGVRRLHLAADSAGVIARLKLLRTAMWECMHQAFGSGNGSKSVIFQLNDIFSAFVNLWEELMEEKERRSAEEAELYKCKAQHTEILADELEAEQNYNQQFPDVFSVFEDLAADDEMPLDAEHVQKKTPKASDHERLGAAALSAESFMLGDLLNEVVACHSVVYRALSEGRPIPVPEGRQTVQRFEQSYALGAALLLNMALIVPAELDEITRTGHLMTAALRFKALANHPSVDGTVDVQKACVEEAVLVQEPLLGFKARLAALLVEWPDHPVLLQLDAIADRILSFALDSPLKQIITGVELLLARSRIWEETAAKHVSLTSELALIASLATRWRRLELSSWRKLLVSTSEQCAAAARKAWFHLYRILIHGAMSSEQVASALEQFIQASPLGEFEERLGLLESFERHLASLYAITEQEKQQQHWRGLMFVIHNIRRYHSTFLPAIQKCMADNLAPLEKHLKDFVALAKWEDRGYYALKQSTETAQRQLHRLVRKAREALGEPALNVFTLTSKAMGFEDLPTSKSEQVATLSELRVTQKHATLCSRSTNPGNNRGDVFFVGEEHGAVFLHRLPRLLNRFRDVIASTLENNTNVLSQLPEDMASEAAERAWHLRTDTQKGAKARKKKALTDFFHALGDAGVSKRRSAVPLSSRGVLAWLNLEDPDLTALTRSSDSAHMLWAKADDYYYKTMVRLQKLAEVSVQPHQDISMKEVEIAVHTSEHLFYMVQQGRRTLRKAAGYHRDIRCLVKVIESLKRHRTAVPHQAICNEWLGAQQERIMALLRLAVETKELLAATATAESALSAKQQLQTGASKVESCLPLLTECRQCLIDARTDSAAIMPSGLLFITPDILDLLTRNAMAVSELHEALSSLEDSLPGAHALKSAAHRVMVEETEMLSQNERLNGGTTADESKEPCVIHELDAAVAAALVWAQSGAASKGVGELEEADIIPKQLGKLEQQLCLHRVEEVCTAVSRALSMLNEDASLSAVQLVCELAPLLHMLESGLNDLSLAYLAYHKSMNKLAYIMASLFVGLVQEGFCMPEGCEETEGEAEKMTEGTGLGDGDTRGAKDISDELQDQDQLLGADQKGAKKEEQQQKHEQDDSSNEQNKGIEMDDDFEGQLEDVAPMQESGDDDEEEDGGRMDQQMGDTGNAAEAVDEKFWENEDDDDGPPPRDDTIADDKTVGVKDTSQLEYGNGEDEEKKHEPPTTETDERAPPNQGQPDDQGGEGEESSDAQAADAEDFVQPEAPDLEFELPDDMNLDGGEMNEEPLQEHVEEAGQDDERPAPPVDTQEDPKMDDDGDDPRQNTRDDGNTDDHQGEPDSEPREEPAADGEVQTHSEDYIDDLGGGEENDVEMHERKEEEREPAVEDAYGGDRGAPSSVTQNADSGKKGAADAHAEEDQPLPKVETADAMQMEKADKTEAGVSGAGGAGGGDRDQSVRESAQGRDAQPQNAEDRPPAMQPSSANPFRNIGDALERWKAKLSVSSEPEGGEQENTVMPETAPPVTQIDEGGGDDVEAAEYRFLGHNEHQSVGDTQTLGEATDEQAGAFEKPENIGDREDDIATMEQENCTTGDTDLANKVDKASWPAGVAQKAGLREDCNKMAEEEEEEEKNDDDDDNAMEADDEKEKGFNHGNEAGQDGSTVVSRLAATSLEDVALEGMDPQLAQLLAPLSAERIDVLRAELDRRLRDASQVMLGDESALSHGKEVWARCEALTSGLVGELTEQLRLILEPTLASKLAGDYRTGKRLNMKKVIGYVASNYRKDKIWMRRTRPDKRQYQVIVAVDDSRSMAETGCGSSAAEAVALICKAMARLEVGHLGVVSFGGSGGVQPLHSLERPFSDSDGPSIMAGLRFDQDNTIADRPMTEVVASLDALLEVARAKTALSSLSDTSLHQLVLIIADGRFHEKEALRRAVRAAADKPGVLYGFIVLDSADNSLLDMQTVSFVGGKPVFNKYMDTFPFPFYIVLRDIASLPRTLADLLRQWFEISSLK